MWHATDVNKLPVERDACDKRQPVACCLVLPPSHQSWEGFNVESNNMNWSQENTVESIEEYKKTCSSRGYMLGCTAGISQKVWLWHDDNKKRSRICVLFFIVNTEGVTQTESGSTPIKQSKWFGYNLIVFMSWPIAPVGYLLHGSDAM